MWLLPTGYKGLFLMLRLLGRRYQLVIYLRGSVPFLLLGLTSRLVATKFVAGESILERNTKPLRKILGDVDRPRTSLIVSKEAMELGKQLVRRTGEKNCPNVAVHAASVSKTSEWPLERFSTLADRLHEEFGAVVHFFGTRGDMPKLDVIAKDSRHRHAYHTNLRLPEVAGTLAVCDLFIGNDSGLSHIAAAVRVPIVVIWGAPNLNMAKPDATAEECTILYKDLTCRVQCPEIDCVNPNEFECLNSIEVEDVLEAARRFLLDESKEKGNP